MSCYGLIGPPTRSDVGVPRDRKRRFAPGGGSRSWITLGAVIFIAVNRTRVLLYMLGMFGLWAELPS